MIAVIADDITGAAEMAGIAHRLGLHVMLTVDTDVNPDTDVLVIATDTRSMTEEEAVAESARVAAAVAALPGVMHIFKKTDSALRGHVTSELKAILDNTPYNRALFLPANPSKGRTIKDGIYYIGDKPLHETDFSFDPEFPAFSSLLDERLKADFDLTCPDAVNTDDIRSAVDTAAGDTLLAGAADLFTAFLHRYCAVNESGSVKPEIDLTDAIIVCGSTQSRPIDCGIETAYMPTPVYDGNATGHTWAEEIAGGYEANHKVILAIADRHRTGHDAAVWLRETMAETVADLFAIHAPKELIIEGGATAYAILRHLAFRSFTITDEIAPGVVRMQAPNGTYITMKPGSYPWGNIF